jgi:YHS domain-containing protein
VAAKDPVCGMMVDEDTAPAKSEYKGKTYYFCSLDCKEEFDADPESYVED